MTNEKTRLIKNFFSLLSLRGLEFLIPLLTIPYLLRAIGVEKYGMIGFSYSFALYFGAIIQYGFGVTATRDIARNHHNPSVISTLYSNTLTSSAILSILSTITAALIIFIFPKLRNDWGLHLLNLGQVIIQSTLPIWLFQGMERMAFITYLNLSSKLLLIFGLFTFVHKPEDYIYVPILNLTSGMITLFGSLWIAARVFKVKFNPKSIQEIRKTLTDSRHAFINQIAPNLYNNSTTFTLGLVSGGYTVGLYTAASKIIDATSSIGYVLSSTFLPYLSRSIENHRVFRNIMLLTGLIGTLSIIFGAEIIGSILHPDDGLFIAGILKTIGISVFLIFSTLTFNTNYLMIKGEDNTAATLSFWVSIVFFVLALISIPLFGINGALTTIVGARLFMAIAFFVLYLKSERSTNRKKNEH